MRDSGPLFVTSGDLVSDRRYKAAVELAAVDVLAQTLEAAPGFATAWVCAWRDPRPARRSRWCDGGVSGGEPRRPGRLSRRAAAAGAARCRRVSASHDRALCAAAVRAIC